MPTLAKKWWILFLDGLCAIAFGIMAFVWPHLTLFWLVILFGAYCIIDGFSTVFASLRTERGGPWGRMLVAGLISIAAGVIAFARPGTTVFALLILIAVWAILRGVFEIVAAVELRKVVRNEWFLVLTGIVSILFGLALMARPGAGILVLIWIVGAAAIARGIVLTAFAVHVRGFAHADTQGAQPA